MGHWWDSLQQKNPYNICGLKWQGIQFATCSVIFVAAAFLSNLFNHFCMFTEISLFEKVSQRRERSWLGSLILRVSSDQNYSMKVICMRTDDARNTCQTLEFHFQQQVTPFVLPSLCTGSTCVVLLLRGPAAAPLLLVAQWPGGVAFPLVATGSWRAVLWFKHQGIMLLAKSHLAECLA